MFIGHFALGFAAKRAAPQMSLATLFGAARGAVRDPISNLDWSLELATKALRLGSRHVSACAGGSLAA